MAMAEESSSDLEVKYQKLAAEFAKVRSHATVLKKALLDEQSKNAEQKEIMKKHEQQSRKHDQEMDSLMFRNEQLSKRISVLQKELELTDLKKGKHKSSSIPYNIPSKTMVDEELQKKIIENAELLSIMTDREIELTDCRHNIDWFANKLDDVKKQLEEMKKKYTDVLAQLHKVQSKNKPEIGNVSQVDCVSDVPKNNVVDSGDPGNSKVWQEEVERWKRECEMLRSKPTSNEQLTEYYETQLREMLESKQIYLAEAKTLSAENTALKQRLEILLLEYKEMENQLESNKEELNITTQNYKLQLDAMTEHLAAQNDKITKQSDEIELLKHKYTSKK